jgi:hypothetical protein
MACEICGLVYRLAYNGDVVAFKMGRRLGKRVGVLAYGRLGRLLLTLGNADTPIRRHADTFPLAGPFSTQPSGPRPVGCFSALLARPV